MSLCGPGQKWWGGGSVALAPFSGTLQFAFTFVDLYPIPPLKRHRNASPAHQHLLEYCPWIRVMLVKSYSWFKMFV